MVYSRLPSLPQQESWGRGRSPSRSFHDFYFHRFCIFILYSRKNGAQGGGGRGGITPSARSLNLWGSRFGAKRYPLALLDPAKGGKHI